MNIYPWIVIIALAALHIDTYVSDTRRVSAADGYLATLASVTLTYRQAVLEYANANPTYSGTVADAALSLPGWFRHPVGLSNYISTGHAFVYYVGTSGGLATALANATHNAATIGLNVGGNLLGPNAKGTQALPSQIPAGATVIAP